MASKKFDAKQAAADAAAALEAIKTAESMSTEQVLEVLLECTAARKGMAVRYRRELRDGTGYQIRHRILSLFSYIRETRKGSMLLAFDSIYRKYCFFNLDGIEAAAVACPLDAPVENGLVRLHPQTWQAARWAKKPLDLKPEEAQKFLDSKSWATEPVVGIIAYPGR